MCEIFNSPSCQHHALDVVRLRRRPVDVNDSDDFVNIRRQ